MTYRYGAMEGADVPLKEAADAISSVRVSRQPRVVKRLGDWRDGRARAEII